MARRPDNPAREPAVEPCVGGSPDVCRNGRRRDPLLLNVLIVARALGPEGRGDVAFLTAIAWLTSNVAAFGIQEANANLAGAEPRLRRALATNSLILATLFGALSAAALIVLIAIFPAVAGESDADLRWLIYAALPMLVLQLYLRFLVQAEYAFAVANAAYFVPTVLNVVVNGLLVILGVITVGTAVATWVGGQLIATLMLAWYVARRSAGFGRPEPPSHDKHSASGSRAMPAA